MLSREIFHNLLKIIEPIGFRGWGILEASVQEPAERWGAHAGMNAQRITPPLQLFRLGLNFGQRCGAAAIGLRALCVTGEVRLAPPGIADF